MKELSTEEKAKRYDEAIEQLRTMMPNWESLSYNGKTFLQDLVHIIPELKESEDERVRKEIISAIKEDWPGHTDWIDWLEKQGEQKPAIKFKIGDIIKCGISTLKVANINYNKNFYELKTKEGIVVTCISFAEQDKWELVEQNPAEDRYMEGYLNGVNDISKTLKPAVWSEEDENLFRCAIDAVREESKVRTDGCLDEEVGEMVTNWLKSLKNKVQLHPKQEWSEEDEKKYKVVLELINSWANGTIGGCIIPTNTDRYINWFKSLPERFNLPPKQEWSEKDKCMLNNVIDTLKPLSQTTHSGYAINSMIDWLKSLKPQNTWKPSEHELKVLKLAAEKDGACLMGLYQQLKKLRGE